MGYMRHHAIVVTSWSDKAIEEAHGYAVSAPLDGRYNQDFMAVGPIMDSGVNGYRSFFVAPDGSKEGWPESDAGDLWRKDFVDWMGKQVYDDGSSALAWVEVQYGDDDGDQRVTQAST